MDLRPGVGPRLAHVPDADHGLRGPTPARSAAGAALERGSSRSAAKASWHRSQRPAHAGSVETDGTYRQQRSHLTPPARSIVTRGSVVSRTSASFGAGRNSTSDTMNSIGKSRA